MVDFQRHDSASTPASRGLAARALSEGLLLLVFVFLLARACDVTARHAGVGAGVTVLFALVLGWANYAFADLNERREEDGSRSAEPGVEAAVALPFLTLSWLVVGHFMVFLHDAAKGGLYAPSLIGISVDPNAADRVSASFAGILALGVQVPAFAVMAAAFGGVARHALTLGQCTVPAVVFCASTFLTESGPHIAQTGLPPSAEVFSMMSRGAPVSAGDLGVLWGATLLGWTFVTFAFSVYAWIAARIGSAIGARFR